MNTTTNETLAHKQAIKDYLSDLRLEVQPDADFEPGLHPYHDNRLIVSEGATWEGSYAEQGQIFCRMSDCQYQPEIAAEIVKRFNSHDALTKALQGICNAFDAPHRCSTTDAVLACRSALAKLAE